MQLRILLCVMLLWVPVAAVGQPETDPQNAAKEAFISASKKLRDGDLVSALANYKLAYKLSKRAKILLNIGAVLADLGRSTEFANTYHQYLEHPQRDPKSIARIAELLRAIDKKLGRIRIAVSGAEMVTLNKELLGSGEVDILIRVYPGDHFLRAKFPGGTTLQKISVAAGEFRRIALTPETPADKAPQPDARQPKSDPRQPKSDPRQPKSDPRQPKTTPLKGASPFYKKLWFWTLSSAIAAAGAGAGLGLIAQNTESEFATLAENNELEFIKATQLEKRGKDFSLAANITYAAAGVLTLTSAVLLYFDMSSSDNRQEKVSFIPLSGRGAMIIVRAFQW